MSRYGMTVLLNQLEMALNEDAVYEDAASKYYGKVIKSVELIDKDNINFIKIVFEDGTTIKLEDAGQSCCESRYITTDDDLTRLNDKKLVEISLKEGQEIEEDWSCHETQFVEILTEDGLPVSFTTHVEHNGYYGGFSMKLSEV